MARAAGMAQGRACVYVARRAVRCKVRCSVARTAAAQCASGHGACAVRTFQRLKKMTARTPTAQPAPVTRGAGAASWWADAALQPRRVRARAEVLERGIDPYGHYLVRHGQRRARGERSNSSVTISWVTAVPPRGYATCPLRRCIMRRKSTPPSWTPLRTGSSRVRFRTFSWPGLDRHTSPWMDP